MLAAWTGPAPGGRGPAIGPFRIDVTALGPKSAAAPAALRCGGPALPPAWLGPPEAEVTMATRRRAAIMPRRRRHAQDPTPAEGGGAGQGGGPKCTEASGGSASVKASRARAARAARARPGLSPFRHLATRALYRQAQPGLFLCRAPIAAPRLGRGTTIRLAGD